MSEYITELANDIAKSCPDLVENGCGNDNCVACLAFKLIGMGYQKQSEGEWEEHLEEYGETYFFEGFICSRCEKEFFVPYEMERDDFLQTVKFCPNCGAKMKGGAE